MFIVKKKLKPGGSGMFMSCLGAGKGSLCIQEIGVVCGEAKITPSDRLVVRD